MSHSTTNQEKIACIFLQAVRFEPSSKGRLASSKLLIGGELFRKTVLRNNDNVAFVHDLDYRQVINRGASVEMSLVSKPSSNPMFESTISFSEIYEHAQRGETSILKEHTDGKLTLVIRVVKISEIREDVMGANEFAQRTQSVLNRLGRSANIISGILVISKVIEGLHPVVGLVLSCIGIVYETLEKEGQQNEEIIELISEMSDVLEYTFDVDRFISLARLKTAIEDMRKTILETVEYINTRSKKRNLLSVQFPSDRSKIGNLRSRFQQLKSTLYQGVAVETTLLVQSLADDKYLSQLRVGNQPLPRRCLEGTRQDILALIFDWARNFALHNILLIFAYPGTGKSTIAAHAAAVLRDLGRLGLLFAFNRKQGTDLASMWCAIAYRLAEVYPQCREAIIKRLKDSSFELSNATSTQLFKQLVFEPLQTLAKSSAAQRFPVIVIDALDECGGLNDKSNDRRDLLTQISEWSKLPPEFKLIVTSRDEHDIQQVFTHTPHQSVPILTGASVKEQSTRDIQLLLKHEFTEIITRCDLPEGWPGEDVIVRMSRQAAGIFIWAVTAIGYIKEYDPKSRLASVLGSTFPQGDVYALYEQILLSTFRSEDASKGFVAAAGIIIAAEVPLTVDDLARLAGMEKSVVRDICNRLRTVLEDLDTPRFRHQSFVDFLVGHQVGTSPHDTRCPERFRITLAEADRTLTDSSFRIMNEELHFNMCNAKSSFSYNGESTRSCLQTEVPRLIAYTCTYWGFHLKHMTGNVDVQQVSTFLNKNLLFWFDLLSGLGKVGSASPALVYLGRYLSTIQLEKSPQSIGQIILLAKDAHQFIQYFTPAITFSAPHTYISTLPFAPEDSEMVRVYGPRFENAIELEIGRLEEWPKEAAIIRLHGSEACSFAISSDSQQIVSGSEDGSVRIWDLSTGELVAGPFRGHKESVISVAFSSDNKYVASGSRECAIRVWDVATESLVAGPFKSEKSGLSNTVIVTFSCDNKRIVSSFGTKIYIWDVDTKTLVVGPLIAQEGAIDFISSSLDGKYIAFGSADGETIRVWDVNAGKMTLQLNNDSGRLSCISFSHNGQRLASGSPVQIHNMCMDTRPVSSWGGDQYPITSISFSHDDKYIVSGSGGGIVQIWCADTGELVAGPLKAHEKSVEFVTFSNDDNCVISGSWDNSIRIWDFGFDESAIFQRRERKIKRVAISDNGEWAVSCTESVMPIAVWDIKADAKKAEYYHGGWMVDCIAISSDGNAVAYALSDDHVLLWHVDEDEPLQLGKVDRSILSLTFSRDDERLLSCSEFGKIQFWDVDKRELMVDVQADTRDWPRWLTSVAISNDEGRVVSGSGRGAVQIWDTNTGKSVGRPLTGHTGTIATVTFSSDDKQVASGSDSGTIIVWDAATGETVAGPFNVGYMTLSITFSHDVKFVFAGSSSLGDDNTTISLWDVDSGKEVRSFIGHVDSVSSIAVSHVNDFECCLVSGSHDKTFRIWDITTESSESMFSDESTWVDGGWMEGKNEECLFWVPLLHRVGLHRPSNRRVIAPNETRLRVDDDLLGESWVKCYKGIE